MSQKIIITGVSGGFGKLSGLALAQHGHQVVGTMRSTSGKNEAIAAELKEAGVQLVELDVTNEDSVNNGIAKAVELLGGLDVIINNAGVGVLGIQEMFTAEDLQKVFDVNVFGVHRIVRAVAPIFREQQKGTIVHISSCIGRMTFPFYGPYCATKWALEALAESYRNELAPFGIESALIEPGGYATGFMHALIRPSDQERGQGYGDMVNVPEQALQGFEQVLMSNPEQRPERVSEALVALLDKPFGKKPFRTVVDHMGMAPGVEKMNDTLHEVTEQLYTAFGNGEMLALNQN